ncbi:DNA primase [Desulfoplanes formicivorans]|uniref:DNA primase n=1 Tax=Desulfoplanes formicivorans TaxID=1592317 RepID=A0A194AKJ8_9BACT|nr:DNA primase [Desulfoplanes formicivorans]GAU09576.1 DNA primase [Desulfoplanes formicivorans]
MAKFDSNTVEAIKARIDILDLIGRYVELKPVGENWVAPCPFHQETKPSFSVSPARGFYYCFGCQAAGDVIEFYRAINGLSFPEAVEQLAREAGVELRPETPGGYKRREVKAECFELHARAQRFFQNALAARGAEKARAYLDRRHISHDMRERFGLGWGPDSWNSLKDHLQQLGYPQEAGVTAGLLSHNKAGRVYDRFRGRIMFPIHNLAGQVIAFGGRGIEEDQEPKYLNSSETPIYTKGDHLYGLFQARRSISSEKSVLLTEGYVDVITLHQHGFSHACGVLGTALTPRQVHRLAGLAKEIILLFDGDRAGRKAALRSALMVLSEGVSCRVVMFPEGEDADSLLRKKGRDVFADLLANARDGLAFCLAVVRENESPKEIMRWAVSFIQGLKEVSWQAFYIPKIAEGLGVSEKELREAIGQPGTTQSPKAIQLHLCGPAQRDRELLSFAIRFPQYLERLEEYHFASSLCTQRGREFWEKLLQYGHDHLLSHLDEGERTFFVKCQMQQKASPEAELEEWQGLKEFMARNVSKTRRKHLKMALARAQQDGDIGEVKRILAQLQDIIVH